MATDPGTAQLCNTFFFGCQGNRMNFRILIAHANQFGVACIWYIRNLLNAKRFKLREYLFWPIDAHGVLHVLFNGCLRESRQLRQSSNQKLNEFFHFDAALFLFVFHWLTRGSQLHQGLVVFIADAVIVASLLQ
ncbi:hypothetical protein D3C81_1569680 [compost metagenome]